MGLVPSVRSGKILGTNGSLDTSTARRHRLASYGQTAADAERAKSSAGNRVWFVLTLSDRPSAQARVPSELATRRCCYSIEGDQKRELLSARRCMRRVGVSSEIEV